MKLLVILGSVREGRAGIKVANWFLPIARQYAEVDFADLKEVGLPLEMEPVSPSKRQARDYPRAEDKNWSKRVDDSDAVVLIMPEYNHGYSASIKNAIDHIYHEWNGKLIGFVGYGTTGASNSIKNLIPVLRHIKAEVISQPRVSIYKIWSAFDESGNLIDSEKHTQDAISLLKTLVGKSKSAENK